MSLRLITSCYLSCFLVAILLQVQTQNCTSTSTSTSSTISWGETQKKQQLEEPQNLCYCGHQIFKVFLLEKSNQVMGEVARCTKITQLSEFAQHINLIGSTGGGVHEYPFY